MARITQKNKFVSHTNTHTQRQQSDGNKNRRHLKRLQIKQLKIREFKSLKVKKDTSKESKE